MSDDPLVVEFDVATPPEHAFRTWTDRCDVWWPPGHTISGDPVAITVEPHVGGAISERGPDGRLHLWGTVLAWEPPTRLRYRWHLFFDPSEATELDVTFTPHPTRAGHTHVRIEHGGWNRLGPAGPPRRERTRSVWALLAEHYAAVADGSGPPRVRQ